MGVTGVSPSIGSAAEKQVKVALPEFKVTLNGHSVDSQHREYPLLVYNNILYFPMDWYDCRMLGLESSWTEEDGLSIRQSIVSASYHPYTSDNANAASLTASIVQGNITVNGKPINNSQEPYPVLSFRDINYFPLTWHFAHDEFGWNYSWNDDHGFTLQSTNLQLQDSGLPSYAGDNGMAIFEGYYYYGDTTQSTTSVYRSPIDHPLRQSLLFQFEQSSDFGNGYIPFMVKDRELWFSYHVGSNTMGHDVFVRINRDGSVQEKYSGYLNFLNASNGTLIVNQAIPPLAGNLALIPTGKEENEAQSVGNPRLIYGLHVTSYDTSVAYSGDPSSVIIGNELFMMASPYPASPQSHKLNRIYRINLDTNQTVQISGSGARDFQILDNQLYYVKDEDRKLYASDLDGKNEQQISDKDNVVWYGQAGEKMYYVVQRVGELQKLYQADLAEEDALVTTALFTHVQIIDDRIIARATEAHGDYSLYIFDKEGHITGAVADRLSDVFVGSDRLLLVTTDGKAIKLIRFEDLGSTAP